MYQLKRIKHIQPKASENTKNERVIQSLKKVMKLEHENSVYSITALSDGRIVTGDEHGIIRIFSINYDKKDYKMDTEIIGHYRYIYSLFEFNKNSLISASYDKEINIWSLTKNGSLTLLNTLTGHKNEIFQAIPLSNKIIASVGSFDYTIKIWDVTEYQLILSIETEFAPFCLLHLKSQRILACSGNGDKILFFNMSTFTIDHSVDCCYAEKLIELPKKRIALCGEYSDSIDIIDIVNYVILKKIKGVKYNTSDGNRYFSTINLLRNGTFIYSYESYVCQISSINYEVLFSAETNCEFLGNGFLSTSNDKYFIAVNWEGLSIFSVNYN